MSLWTQKLDLESFVTGFHDSTEQRGTKQVTVWPEAFCKLVRLHGQVHSEAQQAGRLSSLSLTTASPGQLVLDYVLLSLLGSRVSLSALEVLPLQSPVQAEGGSGCHLARGPLGWGGNRVSL